MNRIRDFSIGDTVVLKGAGTEKFSALFIGDIKDGYYYLWRSKERFLDGKFWDHVAAGSHAVMKK